MQNNHFLNHLLEKAKQDNISDNVKLLGLKFYDQIPQKNIKSHLYAPFLSKCIEQKGALGHRPSRQSVQSTSGEEYNSVRAHNRILNLTFEMRKQKKFLTPLALEALTEQLSNKKSCLLTLGRRNHTITKFETFEKILNILLDVARVDFSHDDEEDFIENLPIAKRFVYVLFREAEFKRQDANHSLALPLDTKLYRSILEPKAAQTDTLNAQQIYKKRKLNAANGQGNGNGNGNGGGVPFKPYNSNKPKRETTNMFDLAKGRYFEEDLTFLNFQRSGIISMEREFTQYEKENFVLNHSFKEEVTKFLNNEQNKSKENNITVFKMENSTSFKNPHSLAMGTFQHVQPNIQHPFGLNLSIPPLPKFEPGKPLNTSGIGIGAFSLNNNNNNNKSSSFNIDMGTSLTFTLPPSSQDDSQQNLPTISEKLKSHSSRPRRNRFEDSIFANGSMLPEILKEKGPEQFDVSNLWEDYGLSKNDNRFKDLNIAPCGLITKEKCRDFKLRVEKAHENIIGDTYQEVDDEALIESISMLLMGLEGDLFMFDNQQLAFYSKKLPISLANFTHQTLYGSLGGFVKAGTQFYRIQKLIEFFKQQGKGTLVTNIFYELLQDYTTHYSSSIICIKSETKEYLDFMVRSKKILRELEIVYDITFCKAVREGIKLADLKRCIPKSGYLLNLMYNLLNSIELASMHVDLIQYIFQHSVKPLLGYIRTLIFKGLLVDEYNEFFLKYDQEKDCYMLIEDSEEDVELPLFLRKVVPAVVECANNMLLFKTHDKAYYDVFKEENLDIDVKFDNKDVQEYEIQAQERFDLKEKYLEKLSKDLKFSQEQKDYQQSQKRILYLQKIRRDIEAEAEENRKLLEQQKEQRENLKQALADQIYHKHTLDKFNREIEREAEKAQMLEKELNERKQLEKEKRRLLRELRAIQNETAIPEDDDYESDFGQPTIMEVEAENQENFNNLRPAATISTESPQKLTKASSEPEQSELTLRTPEASQKMIVEEDGFLEGEEEGSIKKKARRKWTKEKPKEESKEVSIQQVENGNLLGSPPRIRGYKTPAKEGNAIVIRSLTSDAKASKNRWLQKKIEEKEQGDDWLSIVKERMPIDILVQICVANVIEEQTRLTNKAMVQILLEKHKLKSVLEYLKKSLCGENGDKADNYAETLFKENSTTDWQAIVNSNSYWDEKASDELDFKFFFELKTRATAFIPQNAENFDLTFYMDLGCEMPAIMKRLFTKEDLRSYLRIFTFVIKLRYLSLIVRKQWKTIAKDLMQIEEYQRFAKHAQLFRHRLQTFLSHYQEYVYTAVVEGSWKKFSNKIAKAKSLDDLVKAHDNYLENILKKCFIDTYIRNVSESISKAVAIVLRFNGIINNLANSEVNYIRLAEYKDELKQLETNFTQYQGFMSIVFEKVVERDQQYAFVSQNLF